MEDEENNYVRELPHNNLDFNLMLTDTLWSSNLVNPELKDILTTKYALVDEQGNTLTDDSGNPLIRKEALWATYGYYTRDIRLGNLDPKNREDIYCREYIDFAGDCLRIECYRGFIIALSRAITVLEISQSKSGFLRKRNNTYTQENKNETIEPKKKSLLGLGGKE